MSSKFIMLDKVSRVEEKIARQWTSGSAEKAVFAEQSHGWYVLLDSLGVSIYLGSTRPKLEKGDTVRLTVEKV